jgi:hypothetical protein
VSRAAQTKHWPFRWGRVFIPLMLTAFVAVGLSMGVLVDLAERLFGANPAATARALGAAAIVLTAWTIARLIDAIVWQAF